MNQTTKGILLPVICTVLLLSACKKDDVIQDENLPQQSRAMGAIADDPLRVAKVPLIVSQDYMSMKAAPGGPTKGRGSGSTSTTSDITSPAVQITAPANSSSISGSVNISASASDNVGVSYVIFSVNGTQISKVTAAPYTASWNASAAADGVYTIVAAAYDAAGNWSKHSIAVSKNTAVVTPPPTSSTEVSLQMPPVQNQGSEGSCVAFAIGYAARSADRYYSSQNNSYSFTSNVFSPEYLYNQTKVEASCSAGSSVLTALDFLKNNGICTWASMPYSTSNGCALLPNSTQTAEASNFKITSYKQIYTTDLAAIKAALSSNHPLIITFMVDSYFYNAGPGFIWKSFSGTNYGRHAVAICGFDDTKRAVKIMNSWGTSWGDSGYTWIDYDFLQSVNSIVFAINY